MRSAASPAPPAPASIAIVERDDDARDPRPRRASRALNAIVSRNIVARRARGTSGQPLHAEAREEDRLDAALPDHQAGGHDERHRNREADRPALARSQADESKGLGRIHAVTLGAGRAERHVRLMT
jgi:hypothetical protein